MVRSILVPLDGTCSAEAALPAAETLAGALGARLLLVRPVPARVRFAGGASPACRAAEAHAYLQRCAEDVHTRHPFVHVGASAPYGPWPDAVLDEASLAGVEMILVDRRLAGDSGDALPGEPVGRAALALSRRADVPLIFLPPHMSGLTLAPPSDGQRLRVLIPLDGSPAAEAILPVIVRIGAGLPLSATVLHVLPPPDAPLDGRPQLSWATASHYCRQVADWLERYGVPSRVEIRVGAPLEEIGRAALDLAETRGGVLALGLPEALPWRFGYSAEPLLRAAALPVLQLRSRRTEHVVPAAGELPVPVGQWDHGTHHSALAKSRL